MPTPTYTPLAEVTLAGQSTQVIFESVSQAYRDLVLVLSVTGSSGGSPSLRFNSDSSGNYSYVAMAGNGSSALSDSGSGNNQMYLVDYFAISTTPNVIKVDIMDYSATDKHKTALITNDLASSGTEVMAGRWASTSAISSILVTNVFGFAAGSTFTLFGIASA